MYRDARAELDDLKGKDPFIDIQWPLNQKPTPYPFTTEEKERARDTLLSVGVDAVHDRNQAERSIRIAPDRHQRRDLRNQHHAKPASRRR